MNLAQSKRILLVVFEADLVVLAAGAARADEPGYPGVTVFRDDYHGGLRERKRASMIRFRSSY